MVFLIRWSDTRHPEYDFDANELVYRDSSGKETGRDVLTGPVDGTAVPLPASQLPAAAAEARARVARPAPGRTAVGRTARGGFVLRGGAGDQRGDEPSAQPLQ